jgi:hypothetical protein
MPDLGLQRREFYAHGTADGHRPPGREPRAGIRFPSFFVLLFQIVDGDLLVDSYRVALAATVQSTHERASRDAGTHVVHYRARYVTGGYGQGLIETADIPEIRL